MLITRFKGKILQKSKTHSTYTIVPLMFDNRSVYSNVKAHNTPFDISTED